MFGRAPSPRRLSAQRAASLTEYALLIVGVMLIGAGSYKLLGNTMSKRLGGAGSSVAGGSGGGEGAGGGGGSAAGGGGGGGGGVGGGGAGGQKSTTTKASMGTGKGEGEGAGGGSSGGATAKSGDSADDDGPNMLSTGGVFDSEASLRRTMAISFLAAGALALVYFAFKARKVQKAANDAAGGGSGEK